MRLLNVVILMCCFILCLQAGKLYAQPISFNLLYDKIDNTYTEGKTTLIKTHDGGYVLFATGYGTQLEYYPWLLKIDSIGNTVWSKKYPIQDKMVLGYAMDTTFEGGYICAGSYGVDTNHCYIYLMMTDSLGDTLRTKTIEVATSSMICRTIRQTHDRGYIIGGKQIVSGNECGFIVKVDSVGNYLWKKELCAGTYSEVMKVWDLGDSSFCIQRNLPTGFDIIKFVGNTQTSQTIPQGSRTYPPIVERTRDGGFMSVVSTGYTIGLSNYDSSFQARWAKSFTVTNQSFVKSVVQTSDSGYYILYSDGNNYGIKTNSQGDTDWVRYLNMRYTGFLQNAIATNDNGFLLAGFYHYEFHDPRYFLMLAKVAEDGVLGVTEDFDGMPQSMRLFQNYPNPFNPTTNLSYGIRQTAFVSLRVFNLLGQEVAELVNEKKQAGDYSVVWDASGFPSGVYFYRLSASTETGEQFSSVKKLVLMK